MKVCVLQADYADSQVAYRDFDPPRNLSPLLPQAQVDHLFLRKATVYHQLRKASLENYDIYVNLCEAYLDWDTPSLDVIWSLELLDLPYTGPSVRLYDPSKTQMKYVAHSQQVPFPPFVEVRSQDDLPRTAALRYPLFVKPAHAGDSLGVDAASYVTEPEQLQSKCHEICREFGSALVEEYIPGRECTVLLVGGVEPSEPIVLAPIEFQFPPGQNFKTYALKVEEHHPECNRPLLDSALSQRLREAARRIFVGFRGEGYARLDFRVDPAGNIYFLEINFACSVFYGPGFEGSADYVLKHDPGGPTAFLGNLIAEGLARHRRKRPKLEMRAPSARDLGIFTTVAIARGEYMGSIGEFPCLPETRAQLQGHGWVARQDLLAGEEL